MECVTVVHPSPTNVLSRQFLLRIDPSEKKAGTTLTFPRAAPAPARPDLTMTFDDIPENVAAVVFSHLGDDPRDRIRLAAVSKVWRRAEKSDTSLPGTPRALCELGWKRITKRYSWRKATYWWSKAAATRDADVMYDLGCCYYNDFDGLLRDETKAYYNDFDLLRDETKAFELWERASGCGHAHATNLLAHCFWYGKGVDKNEAKALELLFRAVELGSIRSPRDLGFIYEYGQCGVAVNKKESLKWYSVAAERVDLQAQDRLLETMRRLSSELASA